MMYSKNVKNYVILIVYLIGALLVVSGAYMKINNYSSANTILMIGLIVHVQAILMLIYKYGFQIRKAIAK